MTALCRFEMLLPLRFNDGTAVPADLISETIQELEDEFGAVTWETQVLQGRWRHAGTSYRDELVRLFVDTQDTKSNRDFFISFKARLKSRFKQLDIWLTVHSIDAL